MTLKSIKEIQANSFLSRCMARLQKTSDGEGAVYCAFCGKEKYEFSDPRQKHPGIIVLECDCEKQYNDLKKEVNNWRGQSVPTNTQEYVAVIKCKLDDMRNYRDRRAWENQAGH